MAVVAAVILVGLIVAVVKLRPDEPGARPGDQSKTGIAAASAADRPVSASAAKNQDIILGVSDLDLSGIFWEDDEPMLIINGQVLKTGDVIAGFRVKEIRKDESVLFKNGQEYTIKFFAE